MPSAPTFVKTRSVPPAGSIPDVLGMFECEVRFYREIAPVVGVRVPRCHTAEKTDDGWRLELEDLSAWREGGDAVAVARLLAEMHARWEGIAPERWPWLRPIGAAAELIAELFDNTWTSLAARSDLSATAHALGDRLAGRLAEFEWGEARGGALTLAHGDASLRNVRTGRGGAIALLDWEDVRAAPGVVDLAWLLVSSVDPDQWGMVIEAYGPRRAGLAAVMPAAAAQGLLGLVDVPEGSIEAQARVSRLEAALDHWPS